MEKTDNNANDLWTEDELLEKTEGIQVHTDLALEARESVTEGEEGIPGVRIEESCSDNSDVKVTRVEVVDERGEKAIGKPKGIYITLEAEQMAVPDEGYHREISKELAHYIGELLESFGCPQSVLVVGLGNHEVTSDSLGPKVLDNLMMTRHLRGENTDGEREKGVRIVSGIVPGVMAQTGMETAEIVRGVVKETNPEAVVVIDALAARSVSRLATTIQLSNTGIQPGSGVGNHRHSLTEESLGIPVIAVGVPTVVAAAAIVYDTVDALSELLEAAGASSAADAVEGMRMDERYQMVRELIEPRFGPMYVTPGNIDERVKRLSFTISEGINIAFQG
ncbi:GPR endopeptidase [Qiania dongpingensis]|uniref:Germination protease n=1 Tax=Qiania dongpingensis TaxID=2763669 RepID=A0A7G9G6G3_9FIRM|nr:GPR endopeptidase [Qiania dongpingensis]QNM06395.1 GPR endopeptidase [Qiania dongpingensis]